MNKNKQSPLPKNIKIVLIGRGSIGRRHLKNLQSRKFNNIVAYTSKKNQKKDALFLKKYHMRTIHTKKEFYNEKPEIVLIASPTFAHRENLAMAVQAKAHVFMEKPLGHQLAGWQSLGQRVARSQKIFFMANVLRFHPAVIKIKQMVTAGVLGRIYFARFICGQYLPDWHPGEDYKKSYSAQKAMGGGAVLTLQHEIDLAYWLFGKIKKLKACAKKISHLKINVEDIACVIGETAQKALIDIQVDFLQTPAQRSIHIQGEYGSVCYRFGDDFLDFYNAVQKKYVRVADLTGFSANQMYQDELTHFLNCVKDIKKPKCTFHDGLATLKICLAVKRKGVL